MTGRVGQRGLDRLKDKARLPEFWGGVAVVLAGAFVVWHGSFYPIGQLTRMGPGFIPVAVGVLLVLTGLGAMATAAPNPGDSRPLGLRALFFVLLAIFTFAFTIEHIGFVPATVLLVLLASCADRNQRPVQILAMAVLLPIFAIVLFIEGLGISFRIVRWPF